MTEASGNVRSTDTLRVEDLPPVEPPSAGFIVQLFVVPALIVSVICGVYFLFARAVATEQDWRQLVADVKSENPHVRWRAALGLSQALEADRQRRLQAGGMPTTTTPPLSENKDIAAALSELYDGLISTSVPTEEQRKQIEFLSKALGALDVDEVALESLRKGISEDRSAEVRKHSMTGLALLAGRRFEAGQPLQHQLLETDILEMSRESDVLVRHQSAFFLGLIPTEATLQRARELLQDGNQITQVNAAIALARHKHTDGYSVFVAVLSDAVEWKLNPTLVKTQEAEEQYFERGLLLKNTLTALDELQAQLGGEQKQELAAALAKVTDVTQDNPLRAQAEALRLKLQSLAG
jgi:HEAT repeat protein